MTTTTSHTTPDPGTFSGLSADTFPFLRDLREHADRDWFAANRDRYRDAYDGVAKGLVTAIGERLPALSPDLHAEPVVGGSIFRVNRDVRFRADAGPYKDYIDLWFWEGDRALAPGGLYLRLTPELVRFGTGARAFSREALARYRRAVMDEDAGGALVRILEAIEGGETRPSGSVGGGGAAAAVYGEVVVHGERLRGAPRGVDVGGLDEGRRRLLRHTALVIDVDEPAEACMGSRVVVDRAMQHWTRTWPLHRWLVEHVQA